MKIDFTPDIEFTPEEDPKGPLNVDKPYKDYIAGVTQRQQQVSIPGAEAYDKAPALTKDAFKKRRDKDALDRYIGAGETALTFASGIPASFLAGLGAIQAPLFGKNQEKVFQDIMETFTYSPRTESGQRLVQDIGHPLQALPPYGAYVMGPTIRAAKARPKKLSVEERLKAAEEAPTKQGEAAKIDFTPELPDVLQVTPEGQAMRPEDTVWRDRAMEMQRADDQARNDFQAQLLQEEITRNEQRLGTDAFQQQLFDQPEQGRVATPYEAKLGDWRVDENGMPVKVDLSMEAQNLENPLQRNLWGDELEPVQNPRGQSADLPMDRDLMGRPQMTADYGQQMGARGLTEAIDDMSWAARRGQVKRNWEKGGLDPEGPMMRALQDADNRAMAGLSESPSLSDGPGGRQRGAIDPEIFKEGFRGLNKWLSKLTEQPWVRRAFPRNLYEANKDGTPKILLHGTQRGFSDQPRGVSWEGLHAGYAAPATLKAGTRADKVPYRVGNVVFEGDSAAVYPIVIRKGNYPRLQKDFGSFSPIELANNTDFHIALSRMLKTRGYDLYDIRETLNNWRNGAIYGDAANINKSFSSLLKNQFGIDGFWYPNTYESTKNKLFSYAGTLPSPRRARELASKQEYSESFVTWDDNNVKSIYDEAARMDSEATSSMNVGMSRGQQGALDFSSIFGDEKKKKLIEAATKDKLFPDAPKPQAVIAAALDEKKDGKGSVLLSAGGTLEGAKRNSALITGGVRIVQRMKNIAEDAIRQSVFPTEKALRALSRQEIVDVGDVLKQEMFQRARIPMDKLAGVLNEKQLLAYQKIRDMFSDALAAQNRARAKQGLTPITESEAYLSSRWQGDFRRAFYDGQGRLVWYLAADNKLSLDRQTRQLFKQFPELQKGEYSDSTVRSSKKGTDAQSIYTTMLDVLGRDDPAVQKIAKWVEDQTVESGRKALGQEKHFEPKSNIRGFTGDRPWNKPIKETLDMLQQQINYAKNAHNWSALQEAGQGLKEIFGNAELAEQQPNNMRYLKEYWNDQIGFNEFQVVKAIEDAIRTSGMSPNQLGRGANNVKAFWIAQKLAVNLGFIASNVMQAAHLLPHMADIQVKYGGNPISALVTGMLTGPAMAVGHKAQMGQKFYQLLGSLPGYDAFIAKAMKYAEDNSVVARSIYDESPIESSFSATAQIGKLAGQTITLPETFLRSVVFMTYANQLKSSGKFANDLDLFRVAEERTNMSMVDYREGERAMLFNKMGTIGNAANVLQTFPINYYNQWSWALREVGRGNPMPAFVMFGVHAYLAGAMGIPGFAEMDKAIENMKDYLAENHPEQWNKVKNFSLKQLLLDVGGEASLYGGLSTQSGLGLTARAASPIPSEMLQSPAAPFIDLARQGEDVAKFAVDPLNKQKQAQAALSVVPTGLQGLLETGPFREQTSVQRDDGRVYGQIQKLSERKGMVSRTPEDEATRRLGLRTQKEVFEREQTYVADKRAAQAQAVIRKLPDRVYNALRNNDMEKATDFMRLYVELSGRGVTRQQLENQMIQEFTTARERLSMRPQQTTESLLAIKRLNQLLDRMENAGQLQGN